MIRLLQSIWSYFTYQFRTKRRIVWYFRLHRTDPMPSTSTEQWVQNQVDQIWFGGKYCDYLRPSMNLGNIHDIWYKKSIGDGMEFEKLVMATEDQFSISINVEDMPEMPPTLSHYAELIDSIKATVAQQDTRPDAHNAI